jgi:hypothetical protein
MPQREERKWCIVFTTSAELGNEALNTLFQSEVLKQFPVSNRLLGQINAVLRREVKSQATKKVFV